MADINTAPFSWWLESVISDVYNIEPACIAMEMRDKEGRVYTSYWQMDENDRACIIDALKEDGFMDFLRNNKEVIMQIINGEEGDEDGLCEADPKTDSEG